MRTTGEADVAGLAGCDTFDTVVRRAPQVPVGWSSCPRGERKPRAVAQLGSAPDWGSGGRKFKSCQPDGEMSQDIKIARTCSRGFELFRFSGGSSGVAGGLVVLAEVDCDLTEELAGGGVDDGHV